MLIQVLNTSLVTIVSRKQLLIGRSERVYRFQAKDWSDVTKQGFSLVETVNSINPTDDVDGATAVKLQFLANAHLYHILLASASIGQILDLNKKEKLKMQIGMHEQQGKQIDENFTIEFRWI